MRRRRGVIGHHDRRPFTHAPQRDVALAVLRRLGRIIRIQLALRPRDFAQRPGNHGERRRFVEAPGDRQNGIVRLVVLPIESRQPVDWHVFDIGARADGRFAVVVPKVGGRYNALLQNPCRTVLAPFEFVANHGHFGIEEGLLHLRGDHAIGLQAQRPAQVVVGGGERLEVIGAVRRGAAVP